MTLGVTVVVMGLFGTAKNSGIRMAMESWINVHALFGTLLFALVAARLRWCLESGPPYGAAELREVRRHLYRVVYLVLYLVFGARILVNFSSYLLLAEAECRNCRLVRPLGDLRAIFAYSLAVLIAIRVLILWLSRPR
jgi:cytochrome b561